MKVWNIPLESEVIKYNNVKIKEYQELEINNDGYIMFPINKKYKASENIHITSLITILEPNCVYK